MLPKPGVMDPVAQSAMEAIADFRLRAEAVRTLKKYAVGPLPDDRLALLCSKVLANDAIEQVIVGPLGFERLQVGSPYEFRLVTVPIRPMDDAALQRLSSEGQLYLSLVEMQTIQAHFRTLGRDPTDVELETVAQTWSEHCSHKTLAGRIHYRDENGERHFQNMLKETIFAATQKIRQEAGQEDWCVSVFSDNAGVIRFDEQYNVVFKVETHNHPSALEPYGGANTGIGGVIRDPMGTGMGAKPICNTDVFCFAPPDTPADSLPPGVLHPRRVMKGVVSGVRDYGNRMGIPTVNGALYFDPRYLGNPLVYCGNIGLLPRDKSFKHPQAGDLAVAVGGRTGRDGIHGATFSSAELTSHSETLSGGAVQIGNAITEKMLLDVLLVARDRGPVQRCYRLRRRRLFQCRGRNGREDRRRGLAGTRAAEIRGAFLHRNLDFRGPGTHGLLGAAGEVGRAFGAVCFRGCRGHGDRPVRPHRPACAEICRAAGGRYGDGVFARWPPAGGARRGVRACPCWPACVRRAEGGAHEVAYSLSVTALRHLQDALPPPAHRRNLPAQFRHLQKIADAVGETDVQITEMNVMPVDFAGTLLNILGSLNVCSKEWVIRQYDHEVQGGSVLKPLVGLANDGPGDAAVLRPVLSSRRGIVIACGMNPRYGDFDTYWMAASAIDEAVRNCVAVGADPSRIAILDNFCWGATDRPETLGSLVRAALACYDVATALGTPFISGKDSLNNEFRPLRRKGDSPHLCEAPGGPFRQMGTVPFSAAEEPISIPPSLLISALGQVDDVSRCVSMDLKEPGNLLYLVGLTKNELGGSHFALVEGLTGGEAPKVDPQLAKTTFAALYKAIHSGLVCACHDLSEGGLAVAAAEMAFAGGLGAKISLVEVPCDPAADGGRSHCDMPPAALLFSESNTRFLCEVRPGRAADFEAALYGVPHARVGEVMAQGRLEILDANDIVISADVAALKEAWQKPLRW